MAMELFQVPEHQVDHGTVNCRCNGKHETVAKEREEPKEGTGAQHHVLLRLRVRTLDRE